MRQRAAREVVRLLAAAAVTPLLSALALAARLQTFARRRRRRPPRVVFGTVPIINIKYWSAAVQTAGLESRTVVRELYTINSREDFDVYRRPGPLRDYLLAAWALIHGDVFVFFFDGGPLAATPLWALETRLLKLAGKRLVMTPYGSDIAVPGHLGPFEEVIARDYPGMRGAGERVRRRVDHYSAHANHVVRNLQVGYLPRWDEFWPQQLGIDTESWAPGAPRRDGGVVVAVHAANHRAIKGTDDIVAAVERLRAQGVGIELVLLEGRPNVELREVVLDADVLVEQLVGGYAMFAIEGMSSGKPVVSNLRWLGDALHTHPALSECPIVDADASDLADRLRELATDAGRRRELGARGRQYALHHHSYAAVGRHWAEIVRRVWSAPRS